MFRFFLQAFLLVHSSLSLAQTTIQSTIRITKSITSPTRTPGFDYQVFFKDPNGRPYIDGYTSNVEGTPFLNDTFSYARIIAYGDKVTDSVLVRLDIQRHELQYLSGTTPFILPPGKAMEVEFLDPVPKAFQKFKCGFPKVDGQDEHSFYNVLVEGKVGLLKISHKKHISNKNDLSGEVQDKFEYYEDYYAAVNDEMKRLKRSKDFILELLSDQKEKLESFMKTNKLNLKVNYDLIKLFKYYNTL